MMPTGRAHRAIFPASDTGAIPRAFGVLTVAACLGGVDPASRLPKHA